MFILRRLGSQVANEQNCSWFWKRNNLPKHIWVMLTINIKHSKSKHYAEVLKMVLDAGGRMNDGVLVPWSSLTISIVLLWDIDPDRWDRFKVEGDGSVLQLEKGRAVQVPVQCVGQYWPMRKGTERYLEQPMVLAEYRQSRMGGASTYNHFRPLTMAMADTSGAIGFGTIFGEFESPTKWKINKRLIYETISKEAESKSLHLCPILQHRKDPSNDRRPSELHQCRWRNYAPLHQRIGEAVNIRHIAFQLADTVRYEYSTN